MSIKDCFSKKWISYEFSRTCTARDCIRAVEKACAIRLPDGNPHDLILRTDNGPQYVSEVFKNTVKILGIRSEYTQKYMPEDNGDIESFHNSLKTDYIWITELETFEDAKKLMEYVFNDYNSVRSHSSIDYLPPDEFERRLREEDGFRDKFLENRKIKKEKRMKNRIEEKRRLKENVSLGAEKSFQNSGDSDQPPLLFSISSGIIHCMIRSCTVKDTISLKFQMPYPVLPLNKNILCCWCQ